MTGIEWTGETWNPTTGCTPVSPGCKHCYARKMHTRLTAMGQPKYTRPFAEVVCHSDALTIPRRWRESRRVFVDSMSDLFHCDVPFSFIADVWRTMAQLPHTFQIVTKRPENLQGFLQLWSDTAEDDYEPKLARGPAEIRRAHKSGRARLFADMLEAWGEPPNGAAYPFYDWAEGIRWWPSVLPNVHMLVSCEDQLRANERIPVLLRCPAAVRGVSLEPLLGPIDLTPWIRQLSWVIWGSESGPHARPMELAWGISIVEQCRRAGVACFTKQISNAKDRKGSKVEYWPPGDWPREFPR